LILGFVWFLMFWYSQFDIWNQNLHIFYVFQTLDLFKKIQEPNPPALPNPIMSKRLGCEKMSQICNIILHLGNKVKMGLQSHNIRRYLISISGIGCTCDPVVRCVHAWISGPSREVESFFNVLYGKSCIQTKWTTTFRNYYNCNKNNKLLQSFEKFVSPMMKKSYYTT